MTKPITEGQHNIYSKVCTGFVIRSSAPILQSGSSCHILYQPPDNFRGSSLAGHLESQMGEDFNKCGLDSTGLFHGPANIDTWKKITTLPGACQNLFYFNHSSSNCRH